MARTIKFIEFSCAVPPASVNCTIISANLSSALSLYANRCCCNCDGYDLQDQIRDVNSNFASGWAGDVSCEVGVASTLYTVPSGKVAKVIPRYISMKADFEAFAGFAFTSGGMDGKLPCNRNYMFTVDCASDACQTIFRRCIYATKDTDAKIGYQIGVIHGGDNKVAPGYGYINFGEVLYDPAPTTSWNENATTRLFHPDWCLIEGGLRNNNNPESFSNTILCGGQFGTNYDRYCSWRYSGSSTCFGNACMVEGGTWNYLGTTCNMAIGPHKVRVQVLATNEGNTFNVTNELNSENISLTNSTSQTPAWNAYIGQNFMCAAACQNFIGNESYDFCNWNTCGRTNFSKLPEAKDFKTEGLISSVCGLQSFYLNAGESIGVNMKGYISYSTSATSLCCFRLSYQNGGWLWELCGNRVVEAVYASHDLSAQLSYLVIEEDIEDL